MNPIQATLLTQSLWYSRDSYGLGLMERRILKQPINE